MLLKQCIVLLVVLTLTGALKIRLRNSKTNPVWCERPRLLPYIFDASRELSGPRLLRRLRRVRSLISLGPDDARGLDLEESSRPFKLA